MSTPEQSIPSDERLIAALSYFFGALVAFIVWIIYKDRSRLVRFHAVQALLAGIGLIVVSFILSMCLIPVMLGGMTYVMFSTLENVPETNFFLPFFTPLLSFIFVLPIALLGWGVRLWGTIGVLVNSDFRYPLLGRWVENFLKE